MIHCYSCLKFLTVRDKALLYAHVFLFTPIHSVPLSFCSFGMVWTTGAYPFPKGRKGFAARICLIHRGTYPQVVGLWISAFGAERTEGPVRRWCRRPRLLGAKNMQRMHVCQAGIQHFGGEYIGVSTFSTGVWTFWRVHPQFIPSPKGRYCKGLMVFPQFPHPLLLLLFISYLHQLNVFRAALHTAKAGALSYQPDPDWRFFICALPSMSRCFWKA